MSEYNLHYNYRDLFLAPRLALSPKKIWVFIFGNLCGYIAYWILSYLSLVFSGVQINDAISDYGLFPCLYGNSAPLISWLIYYSGIGTWLFFILISITAVSRITIRQLKGDNFFSANDALDYAMKKWKSVIFARLSIIFIIFILFIIACIFAMIGSLPLIGDLSLPLFYIFYFLGGIFTVYSFIVFMVSLFFSPVIIGAIEEDTIGAVFHSYQISFNQPWRIITYHALLIPQIIIFINIFSWFYSMSFSLINLIFGYFMGGRFDNILGYAVSIVDTSWISSDTSKLNIILEKDLFGPLAMASDLIEFILNSLIKFFSLFLMALPNFYFDSYSESLTAIETISGILLSIPLILLTLSVISYGLSILSVGETIIFIIFKKIMDGDNILSLNNEEDINKYQVDEKIDFDRSSQRILSSTEEE